MKHGHISNSILEQIVDSRLKDLENSYPYGRGPQLLLIGILLLVMKIDKTLSQQQVNQAVKGLEKRNIIKLDFVNDDVYVSLEEKGEKKMAKYSLAKILEYKRKQKKWDGKWFMVFFDIPEIQRIKRNYLRKFLKSIGFYQYQQSVYLFPYECRNVIEYLRKIVEAGKYTKYIVAESIEDEV